METKTIIYIALGVLVLIGIILAIVLSGGKKCPGDGTCNGNGDCISKTGYCVCNPEWDGDACDRCADGYKSPDCKTCADGYSQTSDKPLKCVKDGTSGCSTPCKEDETCIASECIKKDPSSSGTIYTGCDTDADGNTCSNNGICTSDRECVCANRWGDDPDENTNNCSVCKAPEDTTNFLMKQCRCRSDYFGENCTEEGTLTENNCISTDGRCTIVPSNKSFPGINSDQYTCGKNFAYVTNEKDELCSKCADNWGPEPGPIVKNRAGNVVKACSLKLFSDSTKLTGICLYAQDSATTVDSYCKDQFGINATSAGEKNGDKNICASISCPGAEYWRYACIVPKFYADPEHFDPEHFDRCLDKTGDTYTDKDTALFPSGYLRYDYSTS